VRQCRALSNVNYGWVGRRGSKRFVAIPTATAAIATFVPYGEQIVAIAAAGLGVATKCCPNADTPPP